MQTHLYRGVAFSLLYKNDGKVYWDRGYNGGSANQCVDIGWRYEQNKWTHFVFVIDRREDPSKRTKRWDEFDIYINGVKQSIQRWVDTWTFFKHNGREMNYGEPDGVISFGRFSLLNAWLYNYTAAYVRSVRTWDHALTEQEVKDLYEFEKITEP